MLSRWMAAELYAKEIEVLMFELSMPRCTQELWDQCTQLANKQSEKAAGAQPSIELFRSLLAYSPVQCQTINGTLPQMHSTLACSTFADVAPHHNVVMTQVDLANPAAPQRWHHQHFITALPCSLCIIEQAINSSTAVTGALKKFWLLCR
jgi:phosphoenolpyruvate carboxylase